MQSLQDKKRTKINVKKASKIDITPTYIQEEANEALGLIKIQIEVKEKNFEFIWRESSYHGIFNLTLNIIPCFCDHTN